ncbi:hypothetical protein SAMN05444159_5061 [Bradyrhizobium lablabi]|uniref:Uncharacterized protein n=1 Tax=Bradyrhizobium lablabi TaxID=722472 RepID=A0A1M6Y308_9BRAD|nr:hypothetical protein SAMN05444159_5061 [Bradyrhizobium lablabi]
MAGLVPAIHVFLAARLVKTWMPGTGPGMTSFAIRFIGCISTQPRAGRSNPAWASMRRAWVLALFHLHRSSGEPKQN